jgi:hypothetical protein
MMLYCTLQLGGGVPGQLQLCGHRGALECRVLPGRAAGVCRLCVAAHQSPHVAQALQVGDPNW